MGTAENRNNGRLSTFTKEERLKLFEMLKSEFADDEDNDEVDNLNDGEFPDDETDSEEIYEDSAEDKNADLSIDIEDDNLYPIHVTKKGSILFTLYFNPFNPTILVYLDELERIRKIKTENNVEAIPLIKKVNEIIDAIFGADESVNIFRHDNERRTLLFGILEKVKQGYEEYNGRLIAAENKSRAEQIIKAKKAGKLAVAPPDKKK